MADTNASETAPLLGNRTQTSPIDEQDVQTPNSYARLTRWLLIRIIISSTATIFLLIVSEVVGSHFGFGYNESRTVAMIPPFVAIIFAILNLPRTLPTIVNAFIDFGLLYFSPFVLDNQRDYFMPPSWWCSSRDPDCETRLVILQCIVTVCLIFGVVTWLAQLTVCLVRLTALFKPYMRTSMPTGEFTISFSVKFLKQADATTAPVAEREAVQNANGEGQTPTTAV
ncbi:hypothetical protein VHEMI10235 [[Torrubiella] hemipterigena]|uniref:MARVEL domain-containing protein n=1 Tax=[Torrubiella] hemipterigena TaxID=1531966 RepID=A0A0A1TRJ9_9HYPO|nr:hypothetical protein VHEMI10235 [[Torrubiella] hemipterigena]